MAHTDPVALARNALLEMSKVAADVAELAPDKVAEAGRRCAAAIEAGSKILACGNGGSAADAQHFVAELIGRLVDERAPLPAVTLSVDPSVVTCIANDYGYEQLFARQVHGLGRPGDVIIGISTSGSSANVLNALTAGRELGMTTISIVGPNVGPAVAACDVVLEVPHTDTARIQEIHMSYLHSMCAIIENEIFWRNE